MWSIAEFLQKRRATIIGDSQLCHKMYRKKVSLGPRFEPETFRLPSVHLLLLDSGVHVNCFNENCFNGNFLAKKRNFPNLIFCVIFLIPSGTAPCQRTRDLIIQKNVDANKS